MPAAHTANFLNLINTALEDISRGVASPHHLHNVRCGIENILSLLKYNNEVVEKADQLSRRAYDYVTYHDLVTSKTSDWTSGEDVDRLLGAAGRRASHGNRRVFDLRAKCIPNQQERRVCEPARPRAPFAPPAYLGPAQSDVVLRTADIQEKSHCPQRGGRPRRHAGRFVHFRPRIGWRPSRP